MNLYVRPREDMSRLHPMSRLGRRKLRRAAFIAARVRMTLGGSFENSNLRSRARARTKLVRHTILDRAVGRGYTNASGNWRSLLIARRQRAGLWPVRRLKTVEKCA